MALDEAKGLEAGTGSTSQKCYDPSTAENVGVAQPNREFRRQNIFFGWPFSRTHTGSTVRQITPLDNGINPTAVDRDSGAPCPAEAGALFVHQHSHIGEGVELFNKKM